MTSDVLHFNVGILGHVDSGKTSLSKSLSTVASTASFDKNPQSQERGITLDLGFSSFTVDVPPSKQKDLEGFCSIQYTLVDCPGHASLIRTIIGGLLVPIICLKIIQIELCCSPESIYDMIMKFIYNTICVFTFFFCTSVAHHFSCNNLVIYIT